MKKKAFAYIELLVALSITAMISIPIIASYRSGMKASIRGVASLESISEGEEIIAKIRADLRLSAIPYHDEFSISFDDMLNIEAASDSSPKTVFWFYRFASSKNLETIKSKYPASSFPLAKITYSLEPSGRGNFFNLTRTEEFVPESPLVEVLCDSVNYFSIMPVSIAPEKGKIQFFWNITLQIASTGSEQHKANESQYPYSMFDFYDVVSSLFFNSIWNNPYSTRNFNTKLQSTIKDAQRAYK